MDMRLRLFGRVLRLDEKAPRKPSNVCIFPKMDGLNGYRSRCRTGHPGTLDTELPQISMWLKTWADLEQLRRITKNKTKWSKLLMQSDPFDKYAIFHFI